MRKKIVPSYITKRTQEIYLVEKREKKQNKILIMTINSYSPFCFFWRNFLQGQQNRRTLLSKGPRCTDLDMCLFYSICPDIKIFLQKPRLVQILDAGKVPYVCVWKNLSVCQKNTGKFDFSVRSERLLKFPPCSFLFLILLLSNVSRSWKSIAQVG